MSEVVLGLATMGAGLGMPGSSLPNLLNKCYNLVDRIIIVDGAMQKLQAKVIYSNYPKVEVIDNPWKGSLKEQYNLIVSRLNPGDWWVMLDDDETPSPGLESLIHKGLKEMKDPRIKAISTPRVTAFTEDGQNFYAGEYIPTPLVYRGPGVAGPRSHIFRIDPTMNMMHSPAGRHVVPYFSDPDSHVYLVHNEVGPIFHTHLKAPELYVYNDCVKALFDTDIKTPAIHNEYRMMMQHNKIFTAEDFEYKTGPFCSNKERVDQSFLDFCLKYRKHGAPEGRLFIWYYNICNPDENPVPEQDWTASLKLVLNDNWRRIYLEHKSRNATHYRVETSYYTKGIGEITL